MFGVPFEAERCVNGGESQGVRSGAQHQLLDHGIQNEEQRVEQLYRRVEFEKFF